MLRDKGMCCEVNGCELAGAQACSECVTYGFQYRMKEAWHTWQILACNQCRAVETFSNDSKLSLHVARVFLESHVKVLSHEPWKMDVIY